MPVDGAGFSSVRVQPRIIIHGGAGNIKRDMDPATYSQYRSALIRIVTSTDAYMRSAPPPAHQHEKQRHGTTTHRSALDAATFAVRQLEDDPLFNAARGAVFTRDGTNELEASVMVSRGRAKRGVGVTGLRSVRNPILLARAVLEHGDEDLDPHPQLQRDRDRDRLPDNTEEVPDVPSAQGHTLIHGAAAERLASRYGLATVDDPAYFWTRRRWEEHVAGLEWERRGGGSPSWRADAYLPQGTCGAVALDAEGVLCVATSTGGLTNKLSGRIGDTPVVGAGFWAEEWVEEKKPADNEPQPQPQPREAGWEGDGLRRALMGLPGPVVQLTSGLRALLADCLPTPFVYAPVPPHSPPPPPPSAPPRPRQQQVRRSFAVSGTGNGDSFMRTAAARTAGAVARWGSSSGRAAVSAVAGRGGELQRSAGPRFGRTGEGEGGMIGIECAVGVDAETGRTLWARSEILQDHNCAGMFRAWIGDDGRAEFRIWHWDEDWRSRVGLSTAIR
ncbi:L-asparaginase precursor [Xylariaceae sp. FL0804]|nr:L-asparaginase precursor [Xylariaceae sp. FL0804]